MTDGATATTRSAVSPVLVLWDIDLTLVNFTGTGRDWYGRVVATVLGTPLAHVPEFPGRTERSLVVELLAAHGAASSEEYIERFFAELVAIVARERETLPTVGCALTGAAEALRALAARTGVVQSLVTGNLPAIAGYKLGAFGLDTHLDLEIGGYGSLSEHRDDLVGAAIQRASAKHGVEFPASSVVVIGDTPADIQAARHHGATAIGVATGRHSVTQLREADAHAVLPDLADTEAVLRTLLVAR